MAKTKKKLNFIDEENRKQLKNLKKKDILIHWSLETRKRVLDKQCRLRSDAAERGVWSGSPLFANSLAIFSRNM